jgi:betaine-aldehyde dehydrogenase
MKVINPSTGETLREITAFTAADVEATLQTARKAADLGPWPKMPLVERKKILLKISQGILEKAEMLARLETQNTGKPIKETTFMDIPSAAETFRYFSENLEKFLQPQTLKITTQIAAAEGNLWREPLGVAVLIVPWNYPLLIASWKLAQALSAGNTVILKPSSLTPLTAMELLGIAQEAGLPQGVFQVVIGSGDEVGKALCSDKRVDLISFTGSNEVGKKIMEYSSQNVKKLVMELGGKSAGIILKDADFEAAVNGSLCSIFLNQGQMCTAMSRIFIEESIYDKFIADFVAKAGRIQLGPGEDFQAQMGPLISAAQRKKVLDLLEQAKKEGAQVLCGGKIPDAETLKKGFFFPPTILAGVTSQMRIFQEEVFGPIVCVSKFSTLEEAIELANASDFALAASIWTKNDAKAKELSAKLNAGTIWVNTYGMFFNELPYGGFKQSGFGKELGREGFLEYTRLKNVVIDKTKEAKPLVNYWYGF